MTSTTPRGAARASSETGSATLELVVLAPALLVLISLLVMGARTRIAETSVDQAAEQAARAASLTRTASGARDAALDAARAVLDREGLSCSRTEVDVDTSGFAAATGTPAEVAVEVACVVPFEDLALPGVPGSRLIEASAASVLDTYRARS